MDNVGKSGESGKLWKEERRDKGEKTGTTGRFTTSRIRRSGKGRQREGDKPRKKDVGREDMSGLGATGRAGGGAGGGGRAGGGGEGGERSMRIKTGFARRREGESGRRGAKEKAGRGEGKQRKDEKAVCCMVRKTQLTHLRHLYLVVSVADTSMSATYHNSNISAKTSSKHIRCKFRKCLN